MADLLMCLGPVLFSINHEILWTAHAYAILQTMKQTMKEMQFPVKISLLFTKIMESGLVERSETAEPEPEPGPPGVYMDVLEQLAEG